MSRELSPQWVLLGLLTGKPMHGYELHQFFTTASPLGRVWHLGMSQMYKLLSELESLGYVKCSIEPQESRPDRKVFHVTTPGREAFQQWLLTPVSGIRLMRIEFLGKLFLARTLGREMVQAVIDVQEEACQTLLAELREGMPAKGFEDLVLRFRRGQIEAAIEWLAYCRRAQLSAGAEEE